MTFDDITCAALEAKKESISEHVEQVLGLLKDVAELPHINDKGVGGAR